jgi:hypothetical protein
VVGREHLIAVVGAFLIGCAVLLFVGCAGERSEAPQEDEQGRSPQATSEEVRCDGRRSYKQEVWVFTTNDVAGCPKGGLLSGTDRPDHLDGMKGDDEIRGRSAGDELFGGNGADVIYGGPGGDFLYGMGARDVLNGVAYDRGNDVLYGGSGSDIMYGGKGEDVLYGGDGNDWLDTSGDRQRDKLYCGEGEAHYTANKLDYVDSSCKVKDPPSNL